MPQPESTGLQDRPDELDAGSVEAGLDALDTPVNSAEGSVPRRIAAKVLPPI